MTRQFPALSLVALLACATTTQTQNDGSHRSDTAQPTDIARVAPPTAPQGELEAGVAVGNQGAVAAAEALAADVGLHVLQQGGNAIDAAIAVGFALAVTHPTAGNLGGGGFMLVRLASGEATAIDYRETAPGAATATMYLDEHGKPTEDSVIGPRAAAIPGTVAGFALAHQRFGKLPFRSLVEPAIALAEQGHVLDAHHADSLAYAVTRMLATEQSTSARYYQRPDGTPLVEGDLWQQQELARTLRMIAEQGADAFYRGEFASKLAQGVRALGGIWTAEDLARYAARERSPLSFDYRGHRIIAMPPPSAGGIVLQQILVGSELLEMSKEPWQTPAQEHLFVELARRAYADRNLLLGDPDFVTVPTAQLTALPYIRERTGTIDRHKATPSSAIHPGLQPLSAQESHETTHYSVVDRWGNAVANTYTLNTAFGSKVVVPGTGILLNNEMDDFASKPGEANVYGLLQGQANGIEPGKRMLSSMTPTLVEKGGKLRAVVGTPGGPTITTTVAQLLVALIDYHQPLQQAVKAKRVHHQWLPDQVVVEPGAEATLVEGLQRLGHQVITSPFGHLGHANCIEVDATTGSYRAVADVTREKGGAARAY